MALSIWDLILIIPLIAGAVRGFTKGLIMEVISFIAFILAIVGGFKLMDAGVGYISEHTNMSNNILPVVSFILIFILILLLVHFIGRLIKLLFHLTPLGMFDSIGGAVLGLIKWAFGVSLILWLCAILGFTLPTETNSWVYQNLQGFAPMVIEKSKTLFPFIQELFDSVKDRLQPQTA